MKLGDYFVNERIGPFDTIIVKKVCGFTFKMSDVYEGLSKDWDEITMYLNQEAVIISKFSGYDLNTFVIRVLIIE